MQKTKAQRIEIFDNIIQLVRENPQTGLNKFNDEYGKLINMTVKTICKSEDKINSAVNQVFIRVWRSADKIKNVENPEGWVFRVALNCAKNEIKERWHLPLKEEIIHSNNGFKEIEDRESFEYLISGLKPVEKQIYIFRFVGGFSFQQIADLINKPLPTVTTLYYRARNKIEKLIDKEEIE